MGSDGSKPVVPGSRSGAVAAFLDAARRHPPAVAGAPRLVFALDATMSRQPTWDLACQVQAGMFEAAQDIGQQAGGLRVQLVYFRGLNECAASRFVADPRTLTGLMAKVACRGGHTQIGRVLRHVRDLSRTEPARTFVLVGDAMEERVDDLCAVAGELGLLGIKGFLFHEGDDPAAVGAFREIARLTGGAAARFDTAAPGTLAGLLRAAAAYAARGDAGLRLAARDNVEARRLLGAMERP
jgi:hypothetical protein